MMTGKCKKTEKLQEKEQQLLAELILKEAREDDGRAAALLPAPGILCDLIF